MRIVIDTNIFFPAFNPNSRYYPIVKGLLAGEFTLLISTPILLEYEEILQKVFAANLLEQRGRNPALPLKILEPA